MTRQEQDKNTDDSLRYRMADALTGLSGTLRAEAKAYTGNQGLVVACISAASQFASMADTLAAAQ